MTEVQIEQRDPIVDNPVTSFEVGIVTLRQEWVGICIKFAMYDRSHKVTHWSPEAFHKLMGALDEYHKDLGSRAFMFRAAANPALVADLPPRHPYHTIINEAPKLTADEVGSAKSSTGIDAADFVVRGPTFEIRPTYGDGRAESIFVHEYTALSLLGYLQTYLEAARRLAGPAAGNA